MSEELLEIGDPVLNVSSLAGPRDRGRCLQFTPLYTGYATLDRADVVRLVDQLQAWLDRDTRELRPQHADPHYNEGGGCRCRCPLCIAVRLRPEKVPGGGAVVTEKCVCRGCNQDCMAEGRLETLHVVVR